MKLPFVKIQGCGNDYVMVDTFANRVSDPRVLAMVIADRHFGIGSDGLVLVGFSAMADAEMRIFNADGSEARMCGNALRCVSKYLYEKDIVHKTSITVDTLSGIRKVKMFPREGRVEEVEVNMGAPKLRPEEIPVRLEGDRVVDRPAFFGGTRRKITCVSMGNPHAVVFETRIDQLPMEQIGPLCERSPLFPERVNTEFVEVLEPQRLKMRVWERGSGETLACGTGACAAAVAATERGVSPRNEPITVECRGGKLTVTVAEDGVRMRGEAKIVYEGVMDLDVWGIV